MNWKPLTILIAALLVLMMATAGVAKKGDGDGGGGSSDGTSGPPEEPTVVPKFISMTGTVYTVELYELKETLVAYDFDDNVWVEKLVPVAEPDLLYFLEVDTGQTEDGPIAVGEKWLLDFGPEWYAADPCLVDSYICPDGGLIEVGPFELGTFTCDAEGLTDGVVSNDPVINPDPEVDSNTIPLMSRDRRNALPEAGSVYAFGRSGGSEIVWIWDDPDDEVCTTGDDGVEVCVPNEEFVLYPKAGSNILWEVADGDGQAWWRGEAPPQAMTSELGCSVSE